MSFKGQSVGVSILSGLRGQVRYNRKIVYGKSLVYCISHSHMGVIEVSVVADIWDFLGGWDLVYMVVRVQ